jgi:hypothetical protein
LTLHTHDLVKAWSEFEVSNGPKVLDGDSMLLAPRMESHTVCHNSWASVVDQADFGIQDRRLHLSLIPQPFFGSVSTARVVILTLNPGLNPIDYYGEFCVPEYREALCGTLQQRLDPSFPHIFLNPRFSWHSGFSYWHRRLARLIDTFTDDFKIARREALSFFARSVANLELLPYHSAFRQGHRWSLKEGDPPNVVVYNPIEARAAHLTPESKGGKAILKHLKQCWRDVTTGAG